MKKILLASAGVMVMSAGSVYAACIPTPSCSSLGYESPSSCEGGIKCPFGNAWNCTTINKITEIEKIIQESGASGNTSNCIVGSIFYSDHTCSFGSLISGKTPIGIVVYSDGKGHGQVMSLKNSTSGYEWGIDDIDISTLQNLSSEAAASKDLASCENTAKIIAAGDKSKYPAAWAAHEYKTEGTKAGNWCLPTAGIMTSIKNGMELINIGYGLVSGTKIGTSSHYWSSSEGSGDVAWYSNFNSSLGLNTILKDTNFDVRPVLEF